MNVSILPRTDNTYDLGSTSYRWKDLYLSGIIKRSAASTATGAEYGAITWETDWGTPRWRLVARQPAYATQPHWFLFYYYDGTTYKTIWFDPSTPIVKGHTWDWDLQSLLIGGTSVITSGRVLQNIASVAQDLLPDADNTRDLGSSSYRWNDLFLGGTIYLGSGLDTITSGRLELALWYGDYIQIGTNDSAVEGILFWDRYDAKPLYLKAGNILPHSDATYDLGSSTYKYRSLYLDGSTPGASIKIYGGSIDLTVNKTGRVVEGLRLYEETNNVYFDFGYDDGTGRYVISSWVGTGGTFVDVVFRNAGSDLIKLPSGGGVQILVDMTARNLLPAADATYDFGSSSYRWRRGYFIYSGASVLNLYGTSGGATGAANPQIAIREDGQSAYWALIKRGSAYTDPDALLFSYYDGAGWHEAIKFTRTGAGYLSRSPFYAKNFLPDTDNTWDLGSASYRWANIYGVNVYTGDINFEEKVCDVCGQYFEKGDILVLKVKKIDEYTRTVPVHLKCRRGG